MSDLHPLAAPASVRHTAANGRRGQECDEMAHWMCADGTFVITTLDRLPQSTQNGVAFAGGLKDRVDVSCVHPPPL
jgi:hypothetical protein